MLFKRYLQVDRYGFFENSLYLTTLRGGGRTLNYRSGVVAKGFCGWYFVICCFVTFCATRLVKCMRVNS